MAIRYNIRMAGVGGQGVVTASHIFSTAVINAGGESTIVPFYGSEKRMAPVESYVRVSNEPIYPHGLSSAVHHPWEELHKSILLWVKAGWSRSDQ
jgi:Pyruvate/2-oxoacid:ferredoxin oxidoreductase gamma subunit